MRKLLILGAGGYGKTIQDIAEQLHCYDKIAFLDDAKTNMPGVLGRCDEYLIYADENTEMYPAIGNNAVRMAWLEKLQENGVCVATLVHPSAYVSPRASLGVGVAVLPKAVVNTGATLQNGTLVNIGAIVDHDVVLENGAHVAPGAIVKAENRIPAEMKVEAGTVIENRQYPL